MSEYFEFGFRVDREKIQQTLRMDEDGAHEFSRSVVDGFFEQAEGWFEAMASALEDRDLETLSRFGILLKGSAATLGFVEVESHAEKIEKYGQMEHMDGSPIGDVETCLKLIRGSLYDMRLSYAETRNIMRKYYKLLGVDLAE